MQTVVSEEGQGARFEHCLRLVTDKALILCKKDGTPGVDFADSERDEHIGLGRGVQVL